MKPSDGHKVRIIQFGVWNREAGPDFTDAAISLDGGPPRRGAIELDPEAADWERHGHAVNPAYEDVVLHVSFRQSPADTFCRTASNREVPRVALDAASAGSGHARALPLAVPGRCVAPLRDLEPARVRSVLEAAAQFRLQRKASRLAQLREIHGADEALYQALAETLGYKSNKLPFLLLSQRVPLATLLQQKPRANALLYGVAGFLRSDDFPNATPDTRAYLSGLWKEWWAFRGEWEQLQITSKLWKMGGQRPVNHPQRRLAALAGLVRQWPKVRAAFATHDPGLFEKLAAALTDPYWDHHYTLQSAPAATPMALLGSSRTADILTNVFFPWIVGSHPQAWEAYRSLPSELSNRRVETAVVRLFGTATRPTGLLKSAAIQQGLLQIYEDFCMQDESDCATCLFPQQVAAWRS